MTSMAAPRPAAANRQVMPRAQSVWNVSSTIANPLTPVVGMTRGTSESNLLEQQHSPSRPTLLAQATQATSTQAPVPKPRPRNLPSGGASTDSNASSGADAVTSPLSGAVRVFPQSVPNQHQQQKSPTSPSTEFGAAGVAPSASPPPKPAPRREVPVPVTGARPVSQVSLQREQPLPTSNGSTAIWYTNDVISSAVSDAPVEHKSEVIRPATLATAPPAATANVAKQQAPAASMTSVDRSVSSTSPRSKPNTPTSPNSAGSTPAIPQRPLGGSGIITTDGPAVPVRRAVGGVSLPDGPPPPIPPRRDMPS